MKGKVSGIMLLFLIICIVSSFSVQSVGATRQVEILSHRGYYIAKAGVYQVIGEVKNVGDTNADFANVTVTFYDSIDQTLDRLSLPIAISILKPGRKSPFQVVLEDANKAKKVDHYSLDVEYSIYTVDIPMGLEILISSYGSEKNDWTGYGIAWVEGEIKNIADLNVTNVCVIVTFYDENGTIVDAQPGLSDPSAIEPNETASFYVSRIMLNDRVDLITDYALTAESDMYAVIQECEYPIPEFPLAMTLPILTICTLVAVALTKKIYDKKS